jgi:hypothetical protein
MIRYKNKILVVQHRSGQWRINTDRGDEYLMTEVISNYQPIDDWWSKQHQSELRGWQMDLFVKELIRKGYGDDYKLWLVHKAGGGYSQPHDIAIMYHMGMKLWVLSTTEHHWFKEGNLTDTDFLVEEAIQADILNPEHRREIYPVLDYYNEYYTTL